MRRRVSFEDFLKMSSEEKASYMTDAEPKKRRSLPEMERNVDQEIERIDFMQQLRNDHYYTIKEISL